MAEAAENKAEFLAEDFAIKKRKLELSKLDVSIREQQLNIEQRKN
jgi:hypothetical protein